MPRFPTAHTRPDNKPLFLIIAKSLYGEAFGSRAKSDIAEAMADWAELDPDEQSFAAAHLHYLDLMAQAGTQRLLGEMRDLLEDIAEALEGEEAVEPPEPPELGLEEMTASLPVSTPMPVEAAPVVGEVSGEQSVAEGEPVVEPSNDEGGEA